MPKKKKKLTPGETLLAGTMGIALFPLVLTMEVYKQSQKKKYRKRRR